MTPPDKNHQQDDVVAFLGDPASHAPIPDRVERIETHGALVFLAGRSVYKIKRAVRYAYMDYSTLERRHAMCLRELEINRRTAPQIYLGVVAITREADGSLVIGGDGTPEEWALHMRRFGQDALLAAMADRSPLDDDLVKALAATIEAFHRARHRPRTNARWRGVPGRTSSSSWPMRSGPRLKRSTPVPSKRRRAGNWSEPEPALDARARDGHVRRCHGDLHLNNIVLIDGAPVLFDAIEFDDSFATIDTLYDLAFVVMDLDERGMRDKANLLLNRYLYHSGSDDDLEGQIALPLFLACRAGIRAMVAAQRAHLAAAPAGALEEAGRYFDVATGYLDSGAPAPHRRRRALGHRQVDARCAPLAPQCRGGARRRAPAQRPRTQVSVRGRRDRTAWGRSTTPPT